VQTIEYEASDPRTGQTYYREARYTISGPDELLCLTRDITDRKRMERELNDRLAENRALIQAFPDQMLYFSREGVYLEVLQVGQFEYSIDPRKYIGKHVRQVLPPEDCLRFEPVLAAAMDTGKIQTYEYSVTLADRGGRHREARVIPVDGQRVLVVTRDITDRKIAEQRLRSLTSQLALAEERERRRIAGELHDRIGQALALAKIRLGHVRRARIPARARGHIEQIHELIEQTITDARSLIFELSPPILYELGFAPAVEWLAEQIARQYEVRVDVQDDGRRIELGDDVRIVLFQAVRELLINAAKHARARLIRVVMTGQDGRIQVEVADDGIGFDPSAVQLGRHGFGLFSTRERMASLGGRLEMESSPGRGSRIVVTAPAGQVENTVDSAAAEQKVMGAD